MGRAGSARHGDRFLPQLFRDAAYPAVPPPESGLLLGHRTRQAGRPRRQRLPGPSSSFLHDHKNGAGHGGHAELHGADLRGGPLHFFPARTSERGPFLSDPHVLYRRGPADLALQPVLEPGGLAGAAVFGLCRDRLCLDPHDQAPGVAAHDHVLFHEYLDARLALFSSRVEVAGVPRHGCPLPAS